MPASAARNTGRRLQQVTASLGTFLKADPRWSEADLEDHFVEQWADIDFGHDERLHLLGRQVRLSDTTEKVDLLAKATSGRWVVIELKIGRAGGADLTQLQSYMHDITLTLKLSRDLVEGFLVAPEFQDKVLNAAARDDNIRLLRFFLD